MAKPFTAEYAEIAEKGVEKSRRLGVLGGKKLWPTTNELAKTPKIA